MPFCMYMQHFHTRTTGNDHVHQIPKPLGCQNIIWSWRGSNLEESLMIVHLFCSLLLIRLVFDLSFSNCRPFNTCRGIGIVIFFFFMDFIIWFAYQQVLWSLPSSGYFKHSSSTSSNTS